MRNTRRAAASPRVISPERIGRTAIRALYTELALHPKPGLVSPIDSGAHDDMDMKTFVRSLGALRSYFCEVAAAGAAGASFTELQGLGLAAERRMLDATAGVNTHRGAIFSLGLLAAACGGLSTRGVSLADDAPGRFVAKQWGEAILAAGTAAPASHGRAALCHYGAGGARRQAADGFPLLFEDALPALREGLVSTGEPNRAMVQTLLRLMARLDDTNLLHRGGAAGLAFVQARATCFLARGGVMQEDWRAQVLGLHEALIRRRLSPGGAADMLAAAVFVHDVQMQTAA